MAPYICMYAPSDDFTFGRLRQVRRDQLSKRSVNDRCKSLVIVSVTSLGNLPVEIDGSVIDRWSVLTNQPGQQSSADPVSQRELGEAGLLSHGGNMLLMS